MNVIGLLRKDYLQVILGRLIKGRLVYLVKGRLVKGRLVKGRLVRRTSVIGQTPIHRRNKR